MLARSSTVVRPAPIPAAARETAGDARILRYLASARQGLVLLGGGGVPVCTAPAERILGRAGPGSVAGWLRLLRDGTGLTRAELFGRLRRARGRTEAAMFEARCGARTVAVECWPVPGEGWAAAIET